MSLRAFGKQSHVIRRLLTLHPAPFTLPPSPCPLHPAPFTLPPSGTFGGYCAGTFGGYCAGTFGGYCAGTFGGYFAGTMSEPRSSR